MSIKINTSDWTRLKKRLDGMASAMEKLPQSPAKNPVSQALRDYQLELERTRRPAISGSGNVGGAKWPGFSEAYVAYYRGGSGSSIGALSKRENLTPSQLRALGGAIGGGVSTPSQARRFGKRRVTLSKGTEPVPVWPVKRARGNGKTKGRLTSAAVAKGSGSRYKPGDRQLGSRAGGMWSDWISQKPKLSGNGKTATMTSPYKYSARQDAMRPLMGPVFKRYTRRRLYIRTRDYVRIVIAKGGKV